MQGVDSHVMLERTGRAGAVPADLTELRLFTKCRNERLRLPAFLRHYRRLGVRRFIVVDNASTDGTTEYLLEEPDVHVFWTDGGFRAARGGTTWLNQMLGRFGVGRWCVTADVDELLVYPGSDDTGLDELTRYLDRTGYEALASLMLDCYPGGPLRDVKYSPGDDLAAAAPYFDSGPYDRMPHHECPGFLAYGGVRERVFFPESYDEGLVRKLHVKLYHRLLLGLPVVKDSKWILARRPHFPPCLTKVPLVRWAADTKYLNVNHFCSPRRVAPETSVLLHYKFLQDFHARATLEARRGEYYDGAIEFRRYAARLARDPALDLRGPMSIRYENPEQVIRLGLMTDTAGWAEARRRPRAAANA